MLFFLLLYYLLHLLTFHIGDWVWIDSPQHSSTLFIILDIFSRTAVWLASILPRLSCSYKLSVRIFFQCFNYDRYYCHFPIPQFHALPCEAHILSYCIPLWGLLGQWNLTPGIFPLRRLHMFESQNRGGFFPTIYLACAYILELYC